jgi:hypothetical protein
VGPANGVEGTYLFLKAQGNSADGTDGNALHKVSGETGNLVTETLSLDDSNVIDNSLVGVEIGGEPAIEHTELAREVVTQGTYFP